MKTKEEIENNFLSKAETFYYGCDGGALSVTINGIDLDILNCTGDGEGIVYIVYESHLTLPSPFDDELILVLSNDNKNDMYLRLKEYDLDKIATKVLTGKRFSISRIKDTKDFIIRVEK